MSGGPDQFDTQVAGIAALGDPVRRALYRFVADSADAVSRDAAAQAAGVSRALAAFHLDRLADEGLVEVEFRRLSGRSGPGAGRPSKLYRRSARQIDLTLPPREYDVAALLLAQAMQEASANGADVRGALAQSAHAYGLRLGEEARRQAGPRAGDGRRREALVAVLRDHGFEPRELGREVALGNCPFHALAQQFTDLVCGMNLHMMEGAREGLGLRGRSMQPRLAPEPGLCCVRFS
jgi:predicted ArsR family transcriptional regulator